MPFKVKRIVTGFSRELAVTYYLFRSPLRFPIPLYKKDFSLTALFPLAPGERIRDWRGSAAKETLLTAVWAFLPPLLTPLRRIFLLRRKPLFRRREIGRAHV